MEKINTISTYCDSKGRATRRCFHARGEFGVVIIGDYQCQRCEYFRGKDETARTISCGHPDGHPVVVYATDEELRERWRHINLLKIEADTMFDEEDNVDGVKVWSVSQAKRNCKRNIKYGKKKMTKAEAFEYLKGKKVILRTEDEQVELQRFLFNVGYRWLSCRSVLKLYSDTACMFFLDEGGLITHSEYDQESDKLFCDTHVYKETKLDDILSIEIIEEKKETENINIELEKWIEIVRNKFCRHGWSFVISASSFALISGDLIEEKRIKD